MLKRTVQFLSFCLVFLISSCTRNSTQSTNRALSSNLNTSLVNSQIAEANFVEATKFYITENFNEAKIWYEKSLLTEKNAASYFMLAKIKISQNKMMEALELSKMTLTLEKKNKYYYQQLAQIYEVLGNHKEAIVTYQKLLKEVPNSEEFLYELASNYIYTKNYEESINTYTKIEDYFGKAIEVTRQKQQLYLKLNKLDKAIEEGNNYLLEYPDDVDMKITIGEIYYSNNKGDLAIQHLEKTKEQHPKNGELNILLLNIYKSKGEQSKYQKQLDYIFNSNDFDADTKAISLQELANDPSDATRKLASNYAQIAIKNHPKDSKLNEITGDLYAIDKSYKEAQKYYGQATQLNSKDFNLWLKLIQTDATLNLADSMLVHTEQAINYFPNQAALWLFGGTAYQIKKDCTKAIEWFEQTQKLAGNNININLEVYSRMGDCYNEIKEYKKSNEAYESALKIDKNNDYVLNNYSYYLSLRKEQLELAKEMSGKLVKKYPYEANYLDTHAWVLYMLKDYEAAYKLLEIAANKSDNGTIVEHLGDVLFKLGKKNEALEQWKKAKKLGETSEWIDKKIADGVLYE